MRLAICGFVLVACTAAAVGAQDQLIRVDLAYQAPGNGPAPNFSPKGTQVPLTDVAQGVALPEGSVRPARTGAIKVGPGQASWVTIMVTSDADHPKDLCRLFIDRNRNGNVFDDGPAVTAVPSIREKTGDAWTSFNRIELAVPYGEVAEPYLINVWVVRQGDVVPDVLRYSVGSWRSGRTTIQGVEALVAAMDGNNDALFDKNDTWSVLEASAADAPKRVLSIDEAKGTERLMFVKTGAKELVLQFRGFSTDGRSISFAVVDRPVTKAQDRAGDDTVGAERARPRAARPFAWETKLDAALARAKSGGKRVIVDFWTTWCGPCKMMDDWIWSDAEVVSTLGAAFVGLKLDGDLEKALVARYAVKGYPTMLVLDATGKELARAEGYQGSKETLALLAKR